MFDLAWILDHEESFRYQLLDRMKMDCGYYLGNGRIFGHHLWGGTVEKHIAFMKAIWDSFPEEGKPVWLTREQIEYYEKEMTEYAHLKKGDWVDTPRFLKVQITQVCFDNDARALGFNEPTHYQNFYYNILGKNTGKNTMIFAAVLK
jgi:hypothetical protein